MPLVWQGNQTSYTDNTWNLDINTAGTFTLITSGAIDAFVGWGDGTSERLTATSGTTNFSHTYPSSGTYTVQLQLLSGDFRPFYNNNAAGDELVTLGDTPAGWSFGTNLTGAFFGSNNLTTVGDIDTSAVTNFYRTWRSCSSLTSFPLIDTSIGTSFVSTWEGCSGLTSFPLLDTSNGTDFNRAWYSCSSLDNITELGDTYSFPEINLSSGSNFTSAWYNCTSLTSFPALPVGKRPVDATDFANAWLSCSNLTTFPANFFDSWTGTPVANCFLSTWDNCSALTPTSVENILDSIAASGRNAPGTGPDITIDYNDNGGLGPFPYGASLVGGVLDPVPASITTLKGRSPAWNIVLNGVAQ